MSDENAEQTEEPTRKVINLNINEVHIATAKEKFKDVDAYVDLDAAKAAKKFLTKMRTTLAEAHKREKKQILIDGRRLDGEKNRLLVLIAEVEDPISDQLTEIKEAEEKAETERLNKINAEIERIKAFANDRHDLTLAELEERRGTLNAIEITEEIFQEFTDQAGLFKQEANAKLLIAHKNENDRLAEESKLQEIAEEQAAKQKELDERQAALDAEEEKRKEEQAERDHIAQEETDAINAQQRKEQQEQQAKLDQQAEDQAAEQKKIDDENARLAQEAADKEETERKEQEQRDEAERKLRLAPDSEKLNNLADDLGAFRFLPEVESDEANRVLVLIQEKMAPVIEYIRTEARKMK